VIAPLPEPHRTAFIRLLKSGAAAVDIIGERSGGPVSDRFIRRELDRPQEHYRNISRYLADLRVTDVLDVGCGTGGLTIAIGETFKDASITGVDAVPITIEAARVRAAGYHTRATFAVLPPDTAFPFPDRAFDLVTCTSVIEFITDPAARRRFARELARVSRQYILITTPNPLPRIREQHTRRWLGDFRRSADHPWAFTPWELDRHFAGFDRRSLAARVRDKLKVPSLPESIARAAEWAMPWQVVLYESRRVLPR
jgi:SAM-dependent methyltransferase